MNASEEICSSKTNTISVRVNPNDAETVRFPIVPLHAGRYPIEIVVRSVGVGDWVRKMVYVIVSFTRFSNLLQYKKYIDYLPAFQTHMQISNRTRAKKKEKRCHFGSIRICRKGDKPRRVICALTVRTTFLTSGLAWIFLSLRMYVL